MSESADVDSASFLIGYSDQLTVEPGQRVGIKVSSATDFELDFVELLHGDADPAGPGLLERPVGGQPRRRLPGRRQSIQAGSYALAPRLPESVAGELALTFVAWVYPTRPDPGGQLLFGVGRDPSAPGAVRLAIEPGGVPSLSIVDLEGDRATARVDTALAPRSWVLIVGSVDRERRSLILNTVPRQPTLQRAGEGTARIEGEARFAGEVVLAGAPGPAGAPTDCFDGKLDRPALLRGALDAEAAEAALAWPGWLAGPDVAVAWDGSEEVATTRWQAQPSEMTAQLVNVPTRAVTGYDWSGEELRWTDSAAQYGAIHFHSDDLEDAGWDTDAELEIPPGLSDGVYAARLSGSDDQVDRVPFIVRAGRPRSQLAVLLPTLTYLAYGAESPAPEFDIVTEGAGDEYVAASGMVSQYSHHVDRSGVAFASFRRPLPSLRPDYRYWLTGRPHGLGADLYLLHWLRQLGQPFDLLVDADLHEGTVEALEPYRVVVTGSHPEYVTLEQVRALKLWTDGGGRLMYLGGNGFTMVTGIHPELPHVSEIRRTYSHAGLWESEPGEAHLASSGEPGGRWAHRRERPRELVGVETVGMGFGGGRPYHRSPEASRPEAAFVFAGVEDGPIGADSLGFDGCAAYEIDAADRVLGTPAEALVLARATDFGDDYVPLSADPDIRAEIVLLPTPGGGCVFSVGSIAWTSGLSHDSGRNPVATITRNVLEAFLTAEELPTAKVVTR